MRIDQIQIHRVRMPLVYPFRTAFDDAYAVESVLVKLTSNGVSGWGEAAPWESPFYCSEWAGGVFLLIKDWLGPRLLHREIDSSVQLQERLAPFKGNPFAKAGLDLAWWDLHTRIAGVPLWQALGGRGPEAEVGADFGVMESIDVLIETIARAFQEGFKRVKLKFRPGWGLEMVEAVRKAFPSGVFHVDCNSAYRLSDLDLFRQLDRFNLAMIEQPLAHDDLIDHAKLQQSIATPVCLDESITSVEKAEKAIAVGACRWINIKPGRVGGITTAVKILRKAESSGIPCWIGGMLESAIGASHCLALATLPNMLYPSDVFPSERFYAKDLGSPEIRLARPSVIRAFDGAGIACEPDPRELELRKVESCTLR
ncbi:MAG: o-succinylbenzoate synthase [Acidimicrobiia bacterium]|nr:o-succinylbenzoate synthase [Acidimicrobiia bacterium]